MKFVDGAVAAGAFVSAAAANTVTRINKMIAQSKGEESVLTSAKLGGREGRDKRGS